MDFPSLILSFVSRERERKRERIVASNLYLKLRLSILLSELLEFENPFK